MDRITELMTIAEDRGWTDTTLLSVIGNALDSNDAAWEHVLAEVKATVRREKVESGEIDDELIDKAKEVAKRNGADAGHAAASWVFDGNTSREDYEYVLGGIENGDPAVLDRLPSCDLSGQNAGTPTATDVAMEALEEVDYDREDIPGDAWPDVRDEIADAYEEGFNTAAQADVENAARNYLRD